MGSSIERFLERTGGAQAPAQATGDKASAVDKFLTSQDTASRLGVGATTSTTTPPAVAARILLLQSKTGLPEDLIARNLDAIEADARKADFDPAEYAKRSPIVAQWLASHPQHMALASQDLTKLSYLERQIGNIKAQFQEGRQLNELQDIGEAAMLGTITPAQRKRQAELDAAARDPQKDYGITGFFEGVPGAIANQLPIFANTFFGKVKAAIFGGAAGAEAGLIGGAATGALAGSAFGGVGAAPGAAAGATTGAAIAGRTGAMLGWRYGGAVAAGRMEAALAYLEFEKIKDERGLPLDRTTILGAAAITGALNGMLEMVGFETIAKNIPGLRAIGREGIKEALMRQTTRQAIMRIAKGVGESMLTEGSTEFMQDVVKNSAGELSTMINDGSINTASPSEILDRIFSPEHVAEALSDARAGAQGGGGMALAGGAGSMVSHFNNIKKAEQRQQFFQAIGSEVGKSELIKAMPEKMQEVVEKLTKDGPIENIYVPVEAWNEYWQSQNVSPADAAVEVNGDRTSYDEAQQTGGDITIRTARWAVTIAPSEHNKFFSEVMRLAPDEMNAKEAKELRAQLDAEDQARSEEAKAGEEAGASVQENIAEQLRATGRFTESQIAAQAQLHGDIFRTLGQRTGIDPLELFNRYGLKILAPDGTETPVVTQAEQTHEQTAGEWAAIQRQVEALRTTLTEHVDRNLTDPKQKEEIKNEQYVLDQLHEAATTQNLDRVREVIALANSYTTLVRPDFMARLQRGAPAVIEASMRSVVQSFNQPGIEPTHENFTKALNEVSKLQQKLFEDGQTNTPGSKYLSQLFGALSNNDAVGARRIVERHALPTANLDPQFREYVTQNTPTLQKLLSGYIPKMLVGFRSKLETIISTKVPTSTTVEQAKAIVSTARADERAWTGIDDYLNALDPASKITRDELLAYAQLHRVELERQSLSGSADFTGNDLIDQDASDIQAALLRDEAARRVLGLPSGYPISVDEMDEAVNNDNYYAVLDALHHDDDLLDTLAEEAYNQAHENFDAAHGGQSYGYEEYTLPGAEDGSYSEDAIVMPKHGFIGAHFDVAGIIAHIRKTLRQTTDGIPLYFIEEIQSDLHQKLRKQMGLKELSPEEFNQLYQWGALSYAERVQQGVQAQYEEYLDRQEAFAADTDERSVVEPAPFMKTWHELAFKAALVDAVKHGRTMIAWTTGDDQIARYGFSNLSEKQKAGMRGFYDDILVKFAKKFGKAFGTEPKMVTIDLIGADEDISKVARYQRPVLLTPDEQAEYDVLFEKALKAQAKGDEIRAKWTELQQRVHELEQEKWSDVTDPREKELNDLLDQQDALQKEMRRYIVQQAYRAPSQRIYGDKYTEMLGGPEAVARFQGLMDKMNQPAPVYQGSVGPQGAQVLTQVHAMEITPALRHIIEQEQFDLYQESRLGTSNPPIEERLAQLKADIKSGKHTLVDIIFNDPDTGLISQRSQPIEERIADARLKMGDTAPPADALEIWLRPGGPSETQLAVYYFQQAKGDTSAAYDQMDSDYTRLWSSGVLFHFNAIRQRLAGRFASLAGVQLSADGKNLETGMPVSPEFERGFNEQEAELFFQLAYHGTPHKFSAFSLTKIGTGEGAQSFGWGLYFAGSRALAEHYRDTLSRRLGPGIAWLTDEDNRLIPADFREHLKRFPGRAGANIEQRLQYLSNALELYDKTRRGLTPQELTNRRAMQRESNVLQGVLERIERGEQIQMTPHLPGHLYTVELPEDENLLHWDENFHAQPDAVRYAATKILGISGGELATFIPTGEDLYGTIVDAIIEPRIFTRIPSAVLEQVFHDVPNQQKWFALLDERAPEIASRWLHLYGVNGIKYLNGVSRGTGSRKAEDHNFVIFDDDAIDLISRQQDPMVGGNGNLPPRGRIRIGEHSMQIDLFKTADLSTFLHESGHFYLEVLDDLGATLPELADDRRIVRDWLGLSENEPLTREAHETFARGFEAYLMNGKAPTSALRQAFAKFRAWLVGIYRSVTNLNVEVSPEIKQVFNRLIATDDELTAAMQEQHAEPLFQDPEAVGMTPEQAATYAAAIEEARQTAETELTRKLMREVTREQTAQYKAAREQVRVSVVDEVNNDRDWRAIALLTRGTLPDGSPLPENLEAFKLSKTALVAHYGKEILQRLPRPHVYEVQQGLHPDIAADILGFNSGSELLDVLTQTTESPKAHIERLTDQRTREQFGELQSDGKLHDEALKAIHNDKRALLLQKELQHLASTNLAALKGLVRRVARPLAPIEEVRRGAEEQIAQKPIRDVRPIVYQRAEAKAGRLALEALLKGDIEQAFAQKQRQLLNAELYRAATNAHDRANRIVDYMSKFGRESIRTRLARAGGSYLAQIDAIRSRFDFSRNVSNRELLDREGLREFVQSQHALGFTIEIPEKILNEAYREHYKELPLNDLIDLHETVQQIDHLARVKNRLLASSRARSLSEATTAIVGSIGATHTIVQDPPNFAPTFMARLKTQARGIIAAHTKMEFMFEWLDGNKEQGPVWMHLFKPLVEAENAESVFTRNSVQKVREIFNAYTKNERALWFWHRITVDGIESPLTKANILAVALNQGNDYNKDALLRGYGWTQEQVDKILEKMDGRDWQVVQQIWDHLESFWPQIAKLEKDLNGLEPQKVQASEVKTPYGTLRGGYYPIVFDSKLSWRQAVIESKNAVPELFGGQWARAMTRHGHTEARTNTGGKPLLLELSGLSEHIANVAHDLSHRRAVIDINRIVQTPDVRNAIESSIGKEMYRQIHPWLINVAGARRGDYVNPIEGILGRARMGATIVNMGWKITTGMAQFLSYTNTVKEIGTKYAASGLSQVYSKPWKFKSTWNFVTARSEFMRDRLENYDRDVHDALRRINIAGNKVGPMSILSMHATPVRDSFFMFVGLMDMGASLPTWIGAYSKVMDGGVPELAKGDEQAAIDYADKVVRQTQGVGAAKDLANVQQGSEVYKLFTMFYSYFSVLFNQFAKTTHEARLTKNVPRFVASMALLWLVPAAMQELIVGRGPSPDDEPDEWAKWLAAQELSYPFQTVVLLRDVINGMDKFGYEPSAAFDAFESVANTGKAVITSTVGDHELTRTDVKNAVSTLGYFAKLPTKQLWLTGEFFYDWLTGNVEPESPFDAARRATIGVPKETP